MNNISTTHYSIHIIKCRDKLTDRRMQLQPPRYHRFSRLISNIYLCITILEYPACISVSPTRISNIYICITNQNIISNIYIWITNQIIHHLFLYYQLEYPPYISVSQTRISNQNIQQIYLYHQLEYPKYISVSPSRISSIYICITIQNIQHIYLYHHLEYPTQYKRCVHL